MKTENKASLIASVLHVTLPRVIVSVSNFFEVDNALCVRVFYFAIKYVVKSFSAFDELLEVPVLSVKSVKNVKSMNVGFLSTKLKGFEFFIALCVKNSCSVV